MGCLKVLKRVAEQLPNCSALFLAGSYSCNGKEGRDGFPGSQEIVVERTDVGRTTACKA
jgi:hypothetical protein